MDTNKIKNNAKKLKESAEKKHITSHENAVKRSAGRKAKPKGEKFDRRTVVYFKDEQFALINEYCDILNISVNEFIRDTVMEKLNQQDTENILETFIDGIDSEKLGDYIKDFLRE